MRRVLARSVLAGSMTAALISGVALGQECFIVSRSDTGDLAPGGVDGPFDLLVDYGTLDDLQSGGPTGDG